MDKLILENAMRELVANFMALPESYIPRNALAGIKLSGESTVISGVRRCGKSFFMKLLAQELQKEAAIFYLDFDDPRLINFSTEDFETAYKLWLSWFPTLPEQVVMFFDEPQNVLGWELWINFFAAKPNHKVVLTGSNSKMLSSDLSTHLTGRQRLIELTPLSFSEVSRTHNPSQSKNDSELGGLLNRYIKFGGFPRVWLTEETALLGQYFKDIVIKDISTRKGAAPAKVNIELGLSLMTQASRLVNKSTLARQLGFKQQRTISKHIGAFIDCFLFTEVRLFSPSLKKQQRSLAKFYPVDHALARHTRFSVFDDKSFCLECMVASELRRRGYELYYWKSKDNFEVDFIAFKLGAEPIAVQVCIDISSKDVMEREVRALEACYNELQIHSLYIITVMDHREISLTVSNKQKIAAKVLPFTVWAD